MYCSVPFPPIAFALKVIVSPRFCGELLSVLNDVIFNSVLLTSTTSVFVIGFPLSSFTSTNTVYFPALFGVQFTLLLVA